MAETVTIRAPSSSTSPSTTATLEPPPTSWLEGTWYVTHSTLPMWKSKRNVRITYTPIPSTDQIDDLVEYQALNSDKLKSVRGVDTPSAASAAAWDWRGRGLLKIASSHWEVLGYGSHGGEDWVVTYFAKTLFTPAGVDVYSRAQGGLTDRLFGNIKEAMAKVEDPGFAKLAGEIFGVKHNK